MKKPAKLVWIVLVLSLVGMIGSWVYVPAVKVATYQALYLTGYEKVQLWVIRQLPPLGLEAYPVIKLAFEEKEISPEAWEMAEKLDFLEGGGGEFHTTMASRDLMNPKEWQAKREKQRQTGR